MSRFLMVLAGLALYVTLIGVGRSSAYQLYGLARPNLITRSVDSGQTWLATSQLPISNVEAVAFTGTSGELLIASESGVFYHSADNGVTWQLRGTSPETGVRDILCAPQVGTLVLLGSGRMLHSTDQAHTFSMLSALPSRDAVDLTIDSWGRVYAGTRDGQVFTSHDGGVTWQQSGRLSTSDVVAIEALDHTITALDRAGTLYQSTDGGVLFQRLGSTGQSPMTCLAFLGAAVVGGTEGGDVASSSNGATWNWGAPTGQTGLRKLVSDVAYPVSDAGRDPWPAALVSVQRIAPNPARAGAPLTISLRSGLATRASVTIFDVLGRVVSVSPEFTIASGLNNLQWSPGALPGGMYFLGVGSRPRITTSSKLVVGR